MSLALETSPARPAPDGGRGRPASAAAGEGPALAISDLRAGYGGIEVLHGVDLDVPIGSVTALLGANGAGKTTVLRAISAMVRRSGSIALFGQPIGHLTTEETVRLGLAHVPDGRGTFLGLTVEENLRLGATVRRGEPAIRRDMERVYAYFSVLRERRLQQAGTLSGGEQQMLAVGRALMLRPRLLVLDEPSFGLAPLVVQEIFAIFGRLNREQGVSILLVEQNAALALGFADRAYLLETGRIILSGSAAAIRADDGVRRAYLGA